MSVTCQPSTVNFCGVTAGIFTNRTMMPLASITMANPSFLDERQPQDPFVKGARSVVVCHCDEGDDVGCAQHGSTIHRAASSLPSNRSGSGESAPCVWPRVVRAANLLAWMRAYGTLPVRGKGQALPFRQHKQASA